MRITGRSKVMFILADPVDHVIGTDVLNRRFAADGLDVAVSPLHVRPAHLARVLDTLRILDNVAGAGVTIPHKVAVMPLLDRLTSRAERAGAVNFFRRHADGTLEGDNVDGAGFVQGLADHAVPLPGKRVLQLGAGGAGRAIAASLAQAGVQALHISNRTRSRAQEIVDALALHYPACDMRAIGEPGNEPYDLIVNATAVGMGADGAMPLAPHLLRAGTAVADIIMTPEVTPLLAAARAAGCLTVPGRAMLDPQVDLVKAFLGLSVKAAQPALTST